MRARVLRVERLAVASVELDPNGDATLVAADVHDTPRAERPVNHDRPFPHPIVATAEVG